VRSARRVDVDDFEYRQPPVANGGPQYQMVHIVVYGNRPVDALCDVTRQLALDAAMNLT
jgi:hypothetical protein